MPHSVLPLRAPWRGDCGEFAGDPGQGHGHVVPSVPGKAVRRLPERPGHAAVGPLGRLFTLKPETISTANRQRDGSRTPRLRIQAGAEPGASSLTAGLGAAFPRPRCLLSPRSEKTGFVGRAALSPMPRQPLQGAPRSGGGEGDASRRQRDWCKVGAARCRAQDKRPSRGSWRVGCRGRKV